MNLRNDVAVLRLANAVPLGSTPTIGTACLPASTFVGQRCYVAGWGKNDFSSAGQYQAIQKEVDVPIIGNADCQRLFSSTRLGPNFLFDTTSFLCAGGEPGKDACTVNISYELMEQNISFEIMFCFSGRWWISSCMYIGWTMVCYWTCCMGYWMWDK